MDAGERSSVRQVTVAMRWMLYVAAFFVLCAGIQLFILTEDTDRFFAWTIGVPLTAAFLGAGYWAAGVLEFLIARERVWADARPGVPAVWTFTTLTLIATLLHLDIFRFEDFWAWAWMVVYVVVPVALGLILLDQLRQPGIDPPRSRRLPGWLRGSLVVQVIAMLPLGVALFIAPLTAADVWPWPLTELTGRAIGAWLIGWSVVAGQAVWEDDLLRTRYSWLSYLTWGGLVLIATARYSDTLDWGSVTSWVFLFFAGFVLVTGLAGSLATWRLASSVAESQPTFTSERPAG